MSTRNEKHIIFLSELKHIGMLSGFLAKHVDLQKEGYLAVSLDAEIEHALIEKGIPFRSGRDYRTRTAEPMTLGEEWLTTLFDDERWKFFSYRGVSLSRLYFFPIQAYLTPLIYYFDIVANVLARHSGLARCIVFPSTTVVPPRGFCLEVHSIKTVVDVVAYLAAKNGIEALIPEIAPPVRAQTSAASFKAKQTLFSLGLGLLNTAVSYARRKRSLRILASDYWDNLAPYLKTINSAEVFLLDRRQAFHAGIFNIWRFRMRFVHMDAYASGASSERDTALKKIIETWQSIKKGSAMPAFLFRGFSLQPLIVKALDTIVADVASHVLKDIDDTYELLARLKPDVVELRSTMSGQTHFVILARVAREMGIPSLEMQHGIEYYGPGSMDRRHSAEHMGVYGLLTQRELQTAEDSITTHVVGSPRFDVYASIAETYRAKPTASHAGLTVLCIAPPIKPGTIDTYDIEEYFSAIAAAARGATNVSVVIKLRAGYSRQSFYETTLSRAFEGVPYAIAQFEPLAGVFSQADIVVSHYSTTTLEALQCGKPLIYFGVSPGFERMAEYHLAPYAQNGALVISKTREELTRNMHTLAKDPKAREHMSRAATVFLEKEYAFDGKASERAAALITLLASVKRQ